MAPGVVINVEQNVGNNSSRQEKPFFVKRRLWAGIVVSVQIIILIWLNIIPLNNIQHMDQVDYEKDLNSTELTIDVSAMEKILPTNIDL